MMWVDPHLQLHPNAAVQQERAKAAAAIVEEASRSQSPGPKTASSGPNERSDLNAPAPSSVLPRLHIDKPADSKSAKRVSFSHLQIRTYETILGDNPSCSGGPSLGLGWRYYPSHFTATVDEYESQQARMHGLADGETYECRPEDLVLHRFEREAILLNTGYTRQDLADSVRATNRVKNKRRQTVHNLPVAFLEERVEVARRTFMRWVGKKERTRHIYEDWKRKSAAEGRRA